MQIETNQPPQFKSLIVYAAKDAISYNCVTTIVQHFVVKKCFYFKTPDGQPNQYFPVFRVPPTW